MTTRTVPLRLGGGELLEGDVLGIAARKWWALQRWCDAGDLVAALVGLVGEGGPARWDDALARCVADRPPPGLVVVDVGPGGAVHCRVGTPARSIPEATPPVALLLVSDMARTVQVDGRSVELAAGATLLDVCVSHAKPSVEVHGTEVAMVEPVADPHETCNLVASPVHQEVRATLLREPTRVLGSEPEEVSRRLDAGQALHVPSA